MVTQAQFINSPQHQLWLWAVATYTSKSSVLAEDIMQRNSYHASEGNLVHLASVSVLQQNACPWRSVAM